jgi:hypothetical protein
MAAAANRFTAGRMLPQRLGALWQGGQNAAQVPS